MSEQTLYSFEDISREMNIERLTVLYWLNRFKRWISSNGEGRYAKYSDQAIEILTLISNLSHDGMSVEEIEKYLATNLLPAIGPVPALERKPISDNTTETFQQYFQAMSSQQERLATAQEDLVRAEVKKAEALEKRAAAEMKKAEAFLKIASAIEKSGFNGLSNFSNIADEAKKENRETEDHHMGTDESSPSDTPRPGSPTESPSGQSTQIDDLSALIEEEVPAKSKHEPTAIDDLSSLIDPCPAEKGKNAEIDNLSLLLGNEDLKEASSPVDDLSALIDNKPDSSYPEIDDLSSLIGSEPSAPVDDLSSLIGDYDKNTSDDQPNVQRTDDLSALITDDKKQPVDNLSSLIDAPEKKPTDDLSKLIDTGKTESQVPSTINEAPKEESFEHYKSRILNIIIDLKKKGSDVKKTTEILNDKGLKPLSGKGKWTEAIVTKIYSLIGTAAG